MSPHDKQRALAIVRAAVANDVDALGYLASEPVTRAQFIAVLYVAVELLERSYGVLALDVVDGWLDETATQS